MLAKPLLILGLMAIASSFEIPQGATDGVYRAYINESGNEVHELIPAGAIDISPREPMPHDALSEGTWLAKRGQAWCGCGFGMDHGSCDAANNALSKHLNNGPIINGGVGFYAVVGSSVAFLCNRDSFPAQVFSGSVVIGARQVTAACGYYIAGTWRVDGFKAMDYGYMNWYNGLNFCGNAENSPQHHC